MEKYRYQYRRYWPCIYLVSDRYQNVQSHTRICERSYFVYSVTVETAPKAPPSGKEWICIFIQTNTKRPTSGRGIC